MHYKKCYIQVRALQSSNIRLGWLLDLDGWKRQPFLHVLSVQVHRVPSFRHSVLLVVVVNDVVSVTVVLLLLPPPPLLLHLLLILLVV